MRGFTDYKTSAYTLIAANVLPLFGVLFLGWDTFSIVALYWFENVIIGMITVLKMIVAKPDPKVFNLTEYAKRIHANPEQAAQLDPNVFSQIQGAHAASKLFLVPFFAFHYGFFCFVHGVFVLALFERDGFGFGGFHPFRRFVEVLSEEHLWWCVIALAGSHLWSFVVNFMGRGEYRRTAAPILMFQPYARIFVMQFAIIFGAMISMALGSNVGVLMILIAAKTVVDVGLHLRERLRNALVQSPQQPPILPDTITGGTAGPLPMPATTVQPRPPLHSSSGD
jgi:hypothetical protein